MNKNRNRLCIAVFGFAILVGMAGCSPESKKAKFIERAQAQFKAGDYDRAELEYLNALRLDPTNQTAIRDMGIMCFEQGRLPRAYMLLGRAKSLNADDVTARLHLGLCMLALGGATDARMEAVFVLERQPTNGRAMLLLVDSSASSNQVIEAGQRLAGLKSKAEGISEYHLAFGSLALAARDFDIAESYFQKAVELDPKSSTAHGALGILYSMRTNRAKADAEFQLAAELAPFRSAYRIRAANSKLEAGDTNAAIQILDGISKHAPDFLPAILRRAEIALAANEFEKCEDGLKSVFRRDGANLEAMQLMVTLRVAQGDLTGALAEADRSIKEYPRIPQLHYRRGVISLANNDLLGAAASLERALEIYPKYAEAAMLLAQIDIRKGELKSAISLVTAVLNTHPDLVPAKLLLATAYRGRGDLDAALQIYSDLAKVAPNNPEPVYLAGLVQRQRGKTAEARRSFEAAMGMGSSYYPALEQLVYLDLATNNFAAAQARAGQEISRNPSNAAPYLLMAKVYLAETNLTAAKEVLQKAIAVAPGSNAAMALLAKVHVAAKEDQAALKALTTVVASNTNDLASWMQIGVLHEAAGNYAAARAAYEKLLAANPRYGPALNNLAYILSEHLNERKRAYELASTARELFPKDPYVADTFGWVLYRSGEFARALALVSESVRRFPDNPELQFHLGMIHYMMGEEAAARIALQNAVERGDPKASWIEEARKRLQVLAINPAGSTPAALRNLEGLIADSPDDPVLQMRAAAAYEGAGQWSKAAEACQKALSVNTNLVPAMVKLADLWSERLQDLPRAMAIAKRARELDSSDPAVAHTVGRIAFESARSAKDFQWSYDLLQESVRGMPDDSDALFDLARAAYAMGQVSNATAGMQKVAAGSPPSPHSEAARLFLEFNSSPPNAGASAARIAAVLKQQPDYVPALMASAVLMQAEGKVEAARDLYEKILGRYPAFSPAYKPLALLYSGQIKDLQRAYDYASKAREADPTDLEAARILGGVAYERGLYPAAVQFLKQSAQAFPSDGDLFYMLGLAQHKTKVGAADCKESLTRALSLAPDSPFADEAKAALAVLK